MAVRRTVFRAEEFLDGHGPSVPAPMHADRQADDCDLMAEIRRLRQLIEAKPTENAAGPSVNEIAELRQEISTMYDAINQTKQEIATVHISGVGNPAMARLADELAAVVIDTEGGTQTILHATEAIERLAKSMFASSMLASPMLGDSMAQTAQAQDGTAAREILVQATRIFEACNFQDLAGQRVATVTSTLKFIEQHLLRMMDIWGGPASFTAVKPSATFHGEQSTLVNGPRRAGADGHISQADIDALFE